MPPRYKDIVRFRISEEKEWIGNAVRNVFTRSVAERPRLMDSNGKVKRSLLKSSQVRASRR